MPPNSLASCPPAIKFLPELLIWLLLLLAYQSPMLSFLSCQATFSLCPGKHHSGVNLPMEVDLDGWSAAACLLDEGPSESYRLLKSCAPLSQTGVKSRPTPAWSLVKVWLNTWPHCRSICTLSPGHLRTDWENNYYYYYYYFYNYYYYYYYSYYLYTATNNYYF